MTTIRRIGRVILTVAILTMALHTGTAYAAEPSTQCSDDGTAVVIQFRTDQEQASWSLYPTDGGSPVTFGETSNAPTERWTQTVGIVPGTEYRFHVTTGDKGTRLSHSWEWTNVVESSTVFSCDPVEIGEAVYLTDDDPILRDPPPGPNPVIVGPFFDPTPAPVTYLEWIRDVYRRGLVPCSNIGVAGYLPCS